jgi:AmmeMemoRadiSam system protein B
MRAPRVLLLALVAGITGSWPSALPARGADDPKVRAPACAGTWYPADAGELAKFLDELLAQAKPPAIDGPPVALICPHAGYRFSAPTAAAAYATVRGHGFKRVIVLAFSHRHANRYHSIEVPGELTAYRTPLGEVPIDRAACARLLGNALFTSNPAVDAGEHSLELQLPILQRTLTDFKLVPLLIGQLRAAEYAQAAQALLPLVDANTLLVASTDCTHFGPDYGYVPFQEDVPDKLRELAEKAAAPLIRCDFDGFAEHLHKTGDTICGRNPVLLLLRVLSAQGGATGVRAAYDTSGRQLNDYRNSVTYQSFVFTRRSGTLNPTERAELLRLARQTVTATAKGEKLPPVDADKLPPALRADGACFVTLEKTRRPPRLHRQHGGRRATARGGRPQCHQRSPRGPAHPAVRPDEVDELHIEISYLTPMKRIGNPNEIVVGRHGLLITLGNDRGGRLPQVAYERGWTRAEFLAQTCRKAGLPPDAWQRPEARLDVFEAEVFGEPEGQK